MRFALIVVQKGSKTHSNLSIEKLMRYAREIMSKDEADLIFEFISSNPQIGEMTQISNYGIQRIA